MTKALRTRNVKYENVPSRKKRRPSFNFLGLPAELRLRIYEMCLPVTEYITYDASNCCTCGELDHHNQHGSESATSCTYSHSKEHDNGFTRRQPGCFYMTTPDYLVPQGQTLAPCYKEKRYANARMTPRPGILEVNKLIRAEALPVFYGTNDFVFEQCDCSKVTHWLYNIVQPQHLKYIKSISWDGP